MRADTNERVEVVEISGLGAENIRDGFSEMEAIASGTNCTNYAYIVSLNPRDNERLTREQWLWAVDRTADELGLAGQPRMIVQHDKEGRQHWHVVWSRIDADSMTAISDSLTYPKHERSSRAIEEELNLAPTPSVLAKDRDTPRPERRPRDFEGFRAQESGIDPQDVSAELKAVWQEADSGIAFKAAIEDAGYILAKGDHRNFCVIDQAGSEHSLARRLGIRAAELRERMADIDRAELILPTVAEARALAATNDEGGVVEGSATAEPEVSVPVFTPLDEQQAADFLAEPKAELTPDVDAYLGQRFGDRTEAPRGTQADWQEMSRGPSDDWQERQKGASADGEEAPKANTQEQEPAPRGTPQDWQEMQPGQGSDRREEFTAWERFASRMRNYLERAAELLNDEGSGEPSGFWQIKIDAARHLAHGITHGDGHEALQGAARLMPDSWREKVRQGLHHAADLLRNERGEVPLSDFDSIAADYLAASEEDDMTEPDAVREAEPDIGPPSASPDHDAPDMG